MEDQETRQLTQHARPEWHLAIAARLQEATWVANVLVPGIILSHGTICSALANVRLE